MIQPRHRPGETRIRPIEPPLLCLLLAVLPLSLLAAPPVVDQPSADVRRAAGDDFATQVLGDPWDFDALEDIYTPNSVELDNESVNGGIYSARTVEDQLSGQTKAQFWLMHPGLQNAQRLVNETRNPDTGRRLFTREKFPIDPGHYRYFTARVRYSSATAQPLDTKQPFVVYYFEDEASIGDARFGLSEVVDVPPNEWTIVALDLATQVHPSSGESWSLMSRIEGLRIDPTNQPDVIVEIDWIRLVAGPAAPQRYTVTWQGNGAGSYAVDARRDADPDAPALRLAEGVTGTSANVWLGQLPPGNYRILVTGDDETGTSSGRIKVNDVPLLEFLAPDIRGEQSEAYGAVVNGNPWTFIDAGDVEVALDFETLSYANPPGSFSGRPLGSTSRIIWQTAAGIDTSLYRALCYEFEIKGPRDIGAGSVAKIFYGNARAVMTTTAPVIVQEGINEYCLGDIAGLRIDPNSNPLAPGAWIGDMRYIRFDPHEFPRTSACNNNPTPANCRDIRIDSFVLAPFHHGDSGFRFRWLDSDSDDNADIEIWLDDDRVPGNTPGSVEHLLGQAAENDAADNLDWQRPAGIASGTWNVYARVSDGRNVLVRYASGPLVLGAYTPPPAGLLFRDGFE